MQFFALFTFIGETFRSEIDASIAFESVLNSTGAFGGVTDWHYRWWCFCSYKTSTIDDMLCALAVCMSIWNWYKHFDNLFTYDSEKSVHTAIQSGTEMHFTHNGWRKFGVSIYSNFDWWCNVCIQWHIGMCVRLSIWLYLQNTRTFHTLSLTHSLHLMQPHKHNAAYRVYISTKQTKCLLITFAKFPKSVIESNWKLNNDTPIEHVRAWCMEKAISHVQYWYSVFVYTFSTV